MGALLNLSLKIKAVMRPKNHKLSEFFPRVSNVQHLQNVKRNHLVALHKDLIVTMKISSRKTPHKEALAIKVQTILKFSSFYLFFLHCFKFKLFSFLDLI